MYQNRNIQDSGTHNSRYFTGCFSVVLLRVTVDSEFLYFKLFRERKREREKERDRRVRERDGREREMGEREREEGEREMGERERERGRERG